MTKKPSMTTLKKGLARHLILHGFSQQDHNILVFKLQVTEDLDIVIGCPVAWARSDPPIIDIAPVVGVAHLPTERMLSELSDTEISAETAFTISFGLHQIEASLPARLEVALDTDAIARIAVVASHILAAVHIIRKRYESIDNLVNDLTDNPLSPVFRKPVLLLTIGRRRQAVELAERGLALIGLQQGQFFESRRHLLQCVLDCARGDLAC